MNLSGIKFTLFNYRFEILAFLLTAIIFGGEVVPSSVFDDLVVSAIIFLCAVLSVITVQHSKRPLRLFFAGFAVLALLVLIFRIFTDFHLQVRITSLLIFILFFAALSFEVFRQMLSEKNISHSIIFAAFDCYLLSGYSVPCSSPC